MTIAPADRPAAALPASPATAIDLRCSARPLDSPAADPAVDVTAARCQLLAGHGGPHALMYAAAERRRVLVWAGCDEPRPPADDWRGLPWMRGYPVPAWFEVPPRERRR